ncbi:MAG: hypothetical protein ACREV4_06885 [Gammaproteobacteria bacterium]
MAEKARAFNAVSPDTCTGGRRSAEGRLGLAREAAERHWTLASIHDAKVMERWLALNLGYDIVGPCGL